jgi:hypothetical protein
MRRRRPQAARPEFPEFGAIGLKCTQHTNIIGIVMDPQTLADQFGRSGKPLAGISHVIKADMRLVSSTDMTSDARRMHTLQETQITPQRLREMSQQDWSIPNARLYRLKGRSPAS